MKKEDFEQQITALVPHPNPETTADLFEFGLGLEDEYFSVRALLTSLQFIARNFSEQTLQGTYEIISYGSAALPDEMVAAAVYLENGSTPQAVAEMAEGGRLMCFHKPEGAEESSPLAVCTVIEDGVSREFHTLRFGGFNPDAALRSAQQYAREHQSSVTDTLLSLNRDMKVDTSHKSNKLLVSIDPDMTQALSTAFSRCPVVAARITFDTDCSQTAVEYNPLWLELNQKQEPAQGGMEPRM